LVQDVVLSGTTFVCRCNMGGPCANSPTGGPNAAQLEVVAQIETDKPPPMMHDGLNLAFQDLSYSVLVQINKRNKESGGKKVILSEASGICRAGRLLAIMGPSGAGKTTLLDLLAGRQAPSSGVLYLGGRPAQARTVQRHAAYVCQDDAIMASQTVREAVTMAALLTLPGNMATAMKRERVAHVLKIFQLEGCADTPVGDPLGKVKGLSGGERKRTAVAMSAVREPQIFFLDEPTSGLDAFKAHLLVKVLKGQAQEANSTVVCTLHQPSSDIFALFDDLMILLGGHVVFNGPAADAVPHFGGVGFPCPQYANPADFLFMHVLVAPDGSGAEGERGELLRQAWSRAPQKGALEQAVHKEFSVEGLPERIVRRDSATSLASRALQKPCPMRVQYVVLLRRGFNDLRRNPMRGRAQILQAVMVGVLLSLIWFRVGKDQNSVQDRVGVLFFITTNGMMMNTMGVLSTFGDERGAVLREQENGLYCTLPYFLARTSVDLPLKVIGPVILSTIAYWCVGLQPTFDKFAKFVGMNILLALAGNGMGLFFACVFPNIQIALAVAPLCVLPLVMFSGFVINPESIPIYLKWVEWISPPKYAFAGLAMNEFRGLELYCKPDQIRELLTENGEMVSVCTYTSGESYLERLNIQEFLDIGVCALLLTAICLCFTCLAFAGLLWISKKQMAKTAAARKAGAGKSS